MSRRDPMLQVVTIQRLMTFLWENRERPGWSVKALAEKSGVTKSVVYDVLNGNQAITLITLKELAALVGGDVVILLKKGKSKLPKVDK